MKNLKIILFASAVLSFTSCSIGKTLCRIGMEPNYNKLVQNEEDRRFMERRYPGINAWYDNLRAEGILRDTTLISESGVPIHALYAGKEGSRDAVVLFHGYRVSCMAMMHFARFYRDSLGFNVILADLQNHGKSGGKYVSFGWNDRRDALKWAKMAHNVWGSDFVVAHGVSMGAATIMMLSGEPDLPEYVRCFVEDCGFTTIQDELNYLAERIKLSNKAMEDIKQYCRKNLGWDPASASCLEQIAKCDRPMLFIHGNPDNFVPTRFVFKLYDAKIQGYKELWISEGTKQHAVAYLTNTQEYEDHLRNFIAKARDITSPR